MASVNIVSEPTQYNEVGNCIKWVLRMTGVKTETTESRLVYWLEDTNGNQLTYPDQVVPAEGQDFPIDLSGELLKKVRTEPPNFNAGVGSVTDQPEMILDFNFKYKIVTFDKETCESSDEGDQTAGPYKAINVASNWFMPLLINQSSPTVLNFKPRRIKVSENSEDWIYIWNNANLKIDYFNSSHQQLLGSVVTPVSVAEKISAWAVGPGNIKDNMPTDCAYYTVKVNQQGKEITTLFQTTYILECTDDQMDLYFFDNGYSGMSMQRVSREIGSTQTEIIQYNSECNPFSTDNLRRKGPSINEKIDHDYIVLEKQIDSDDERDLEFYRRCKTSGNYYVRIPFGFGGDGRMIKFIVETSKVIYDRPEGFPVFQLKGRVNVPYNKANYLI